MGFDLLLAMQDLELVEQESGDRTLNYYTPWKRHRATVEPILGRLVETPIDLSL
jgi:hypothetical protein